MKSNTTEHILLRMYRVHYPDSREVVTGQKKGNLFFVIVYFKERPPLHFHYCGNEAEALATQFLLEETRAEIDEANALAHGNPFTDPIWTRVFWDITFILTGCAVVGYSLSMLP